MVKPGQKLRKKKYSRLLKLPVIRKISIMWSSPMASSPHYCAVHYCKECMEMRDIFDGLHCKKCGTVISPARSYKICQSCRRVNSAYNECCVHCGSGLEVADYKTKTVSVFGPEKVVKIEFDKLGDEIHAEMPRKEKAH